MVRRLLLAAAAVGLITPLLAAAPPAAKAATLIEARIGERPARLVVDHARQLVLVAVAGERKLVNLARGEVHVATAGGTVQRFTTAGLDLAPDGFRLDPWGPGPKIAGHRTTYHVVKAGERICAEVLVSRRTDAFMADAIRALDLIERAEGGYPADACAAPPFAAYAKAGWPIMAGLIDRALFETVSITYGYRPAAGELDPPPASRVASAPTS